MILRYYLTRLTIILFTIIPFVSFGQQTEKLRKRDRKKDVLIETTSGILVLRLSDSTPLHRDNFLKLVKSHYLDSLLFHRVIKSFMIQCGDPNSKNAPAGKPLGEGGPFYTVPAEFRQTLFHKRGAVAAARKSDKINPEKASSGSQFYIVQGEKFTDGRLDTIEQRILKRKFSPGHREFYKTIGGAPFLEQNYTIFGEVIYGMDVVDQIANTPTSKGADKDRPLTDIRIIKVKLIKRKS